MINLEGDLDKYFPKTYDNFTLSVYQECPRKFQYRILKGLVSKRQHRALDFGIALHLGLASWYEFPETLDDAQRKEYFEEINKLATLAALAEVPSVIYSTVESPSLEIRREFAIKKALAVLPPLPAFAPDDRRTHTLLEALLNAYFEKYRHEQFKVVAVEKNFVFVLSDGNLYSGIIDLIIKDLQGEVRPFEHKTTYSLTNFDRNFTPNQQVTGYSKGLRDLLFSETVSDLITINAIAVPRREDNTVKPTDFGRFDVKREESQIQEFEADAVETIASMKRDLEKGYFRHNTTACNKFGGCPYKRICSRPRGLEREATAQTYYDQKHWDPLARDLVMVEDDAA